jgi:hypothetical protein
MAVPAFRVGGFVDFVPPSTIGRDCFGEHLRRIEHRVPLDDDA